MAWSRPEVAGGGLPEVQQPRGRSSRYRRIPPRPTGFRTDRAAEARPSALSSRPVWNIRRKPLGKPAPTQVVGSPGEHRPPSVAAW